MLNINNNFFNCKLWEIDRVNLETLSQSGNTRLKVILPPDALNASQLKQLGIEVEFSVDENACIAQLPLNWHISSDLSQEAHNQIFLILDKKKFPKASLLIQSTAFEQTVKCSLLSEFKGYRYSLKYQEALNKDIQYYELITKYNQASSFGNSHETEQALKNLIQYEEDHDTTDSLIIPSWRPSGRAM